MMQLAKMIKILSLLNSMAFIFLKFLYILITKKCGIFKILMSKSLYFSAIKNLVMNISER